MSPRKPGKAGRKRNQKQKQKESEDEIEDIEGKPQIYIRFIYINRLQNHPKNKAKKVAKKQLLKNRMLKNQLLPKKRKKNIKK